MADNSSSPPGQPPAPTPTPETSAAATVVVKKYANRRLYNTETSSYITLDNLAEMIRAGRNFVVYDAKSGDDITRGVLTQIIVEEESKGSAMLPTAFLRQLIGFYGGNLQGVVPRYLEHTMTSFAKQQQHMRQVMERTLSPFLPSGVEEMSRQNMALFDRALSMWNPFHRASEPGAKPAADALLDHTEELSRLRHEVESLQRQLAAAHAAAVAPTIEIAATPPNVPENVRRDPPEPGNGASKAARRLTRGKAVETLSAAYASVPGASVPGERREPDHRDPGDAEDTSS